MFGFGLALPHATADLDLHRPLHARDGRREFCRASDRWQFRLVGGLLTIAAMYSAAVYWERRQEGKKIEILPPLSQGKVDGE
jgi:hypothetical protein